jgi:serine/threonine-protein kinase
MQTLAPAAQASADAKRVEPQRSEAPAPKSANRNKTVWIATGAIAAVLALVALGATVPHWMKAHAAGSTASSAAGSVGEPAATAPAATTAPLADNPAATPAAAQAASPQPAGPSPEEMERRKAAKEAEQRKQEEAHLLAQQQAAQAELQAQQAQQAQQEQRERMQAQQHKGTEIDGQVQQRLADIDARATVARRQLAQIRREQAASGVAARGDVEAAGGRLDSDLLAARSDIEAGNTAAAKEDLNKAETELRTVERYLGR